MEEGRRKRILVVDDDADIGVFLEIALTVSGYEPIVCTNSRSKRIQGTYDLALIDLLLEGERTGNGIIKDLAERQIPVILMTGLAGDAPLVGAAMESGASSMLLKPFDLSALRGAIEGLMGE